MAADVITSLLEHARVAAAASRARVAAAISTYGLDISEPTTVRGLEASYRVYTARWSLSDLPARPPARRRPPTPAPGPDRQPPADPGDPVARRAPGRDAGEWEIPRIPLQYDRAVLAGAVVREKLRTTTTTAVRDRAYDVVAHQQAAMPEQLLAPEPADPEHDGQEPRVGGEEAIDFKALRALKASRTDVEALDFTAEQLRRVTEVFTKAGDGAAARTKKYTDPQGAPALHPVREDDQRAHRPQQPDRHRGPETGR